MDDCLKTFSFYQNVFLVPKFRFIIRTREQYHEWILEMNYGNWGVNKGNISLTLLNQSSWKQFKRINLEPTIQNSGAPILIGVWAVILPNFGLKLLHPMERFTNFWFVLFIRKVGPLRRIGSELRDQLECSTPPAFPKLSKNELWCIAPNGVRQSLMLNFLEAYGVYVSQA